MQAPNLIPTPQVDNMPFSPSFDCTKASVTVEKLICGDRELASLDIKLSQLYSQVLSKSQDKQTLRSDQINWIKLSRACKDVACVKQAQELRINQLSSAN